MTWQTKRPVKAEHHRLIRGDDRLFQGGLNPRHRFDGAHVGATQHNGLGRRIIGLLGEIEDLFRAQLPLPVIAERTADIGALHRFDPIGREKSHGLIVDLSQIGG